MIAAIHCSSKQVGPVYGQLFTATIDGKKFVLWQSLVEPDSEATPLEWDAEPTCLYSTKLGTPVHFELNERTGRWTLVVYSGTGGKENLIIPQAQRVLNHLLPKKGTRK